MSRVRMSRCVIPCTECSRWFPDVRALSNHLTSRHRAGKRRFKTVSVLLSHDTTTQLDEAVALAGVSRSSVIRGLLMEFMAGNPAEERLKSLGLKAFEGGS